MTETRSSDNSDARRQGEPLGSTRWSVVLAAGQDGTTARSALETLCKHYWLPIYVFVRRRTNSDEDAHDLTQGFFTDLLERRSLAVADPQRGRFRAFLLSALKNYLANQHARRNAIKRGGGRQIISIDRQTDHWQRVHEIGATLTPDQEFERRWAVALLECAVERLAQEQASAGNGERFEALRLFLTGQNGDQSQADVARQFRMSEQSVRAAVYRLRKRYRSILRDEIAQTVQSPDDVEDELRHLFTTLAS